MIWSAECRLLATPCRSGHACQTVSLPPIPDLQVPMSGIALIPSGLPSDGPRPCPTGEIDPFQTLLMLYLSLN
jgi:hypothetical protein